MRAERIIKEDGVHKITNVVFDKIRTFFEVAVLFVIAWLMVLTVCFFLVYSIKQVQIVDLQQAQERYRHHYDLQQTTLKSEFDQYVREHK